MAPIGMVLVDINLRLWQCRLAPFQPRQVLAHHAVGVLVGAALPRTVRVTDVHRHTRGRCQRPLRDPRGLERMHKLTDTAGVCVASYRSGALKKPGLGYDELARRNPGIVHASISAYGHTGPDALRAGFGLIVEAFNGWRGVRPDTRAVTQPLTAPLV